MYFALQGSYNYVYLAISELYVELYSSLANELNLFRVYMKVSFMWIYLWSGFSSLNKSPSCGLQQILLTIALKFRFLWFCLPIGNAIIFLLLFCTWVSCKVQARV